jgi:hypothetical protein
MNWKGYARKQSWPNVKYSPTIFLEGLMKTTENLSQDSWSLGLDSDQRPPKYEAGMLTTQLRHSVSTSLNFDCTKAGCVLKKNTILFVDLVDSKSSRRKQRCGEKYNL